MPFGKPQNEHPSALDLFAYRNGLASPDMVALIEAHLMDCADCPLDLVDRIRRRPGKPPGLVEKDDTTP